MINCIVLAKGEEILSRVNFLINLYQNGDMSFPLKTLRWLEEAEKGMSEMKIPEGAEMSSLRGSIIKVEDKMKAEDKMVKRSEIKAAVNNAAAEAISRTEEILRERMLESEAILKEFQNKLCEGMTAFLLQNEIPQKGVSYNNWLNLIWNMMCDQQATKPLTLYIKSSLSSFDRYYILNNIMRNVMDEELKNFENAKI